MRRRSLRRGLCFIWPLFGLACVAALLRAQPPDDALPAVFTGGAQLKTSAEHQQLLARAAECMRDGRADLAAILWQKVLDEAADTLTPAKIVEPAGPNSSPLVMYVPLAELVEQTILEQPREALTAYRTTADAEARAILAAAAAHDERALGEVARRFFLSSVGDDAAFALASLALDRHDFVGAFGLLERIMSRHPDYSMPKGELLARLAVAAAHVGDRAGAEQALRQLQAEPRERQPNAPLDLLTAAIEAATSQLVSEPAVSSREWLVAYGNPSRTGQMPALAPQATQGTLAELWSHDFPLASLSPGSESGTGGYFALDPFNRAGDSPARQAAAAESRREMIARWRTGRWRPTGGLLFADDRVFFKAPDRMVCFSADQPGIEPLWQSAWQNRYELDATARFLAIVNLRLADKTSPASALAPASLAEILLLGDRVHQSMTLAHGVLHSIEGRRESTTATRQQQRPFSLNTAPRRARLNWLTAYQAAGGKALWTRSPADDGVEADELGFLAAPTPCGEQLVTPVTDGGTLWLYGLEADTGRTLWKTYLCDEPQGGASPWATPVVAVAGRDVYLSAGCGLVFAVNGTNGSIRWAVRYPRDVKKSSVLRETFGGEATEIVEPHGWDDDVVIAQGRLLVVMASDGDRILALDRRSGERVWEAPRSSPLGAEASYCVGVNGENLYAAGTKVLRRYEIATGRLLTEQTFDDSFGRGCLTADAVYVPAGTSLLKFALDLTPTQPAVSVVLSTEEPLGNLFSDGRGLWGVGAGRLYALTTLEERLATLSGRVTAGDVDAQLTRMRLYLKDGRIEDSLGDLRGAFDKLQTQLSPDDAAKRLFAALIDERLPREHPGRVLRLLGELFAAAPPAVRQSLTAQRGMAEVLATCINAIRQQKSRDAVAVLLASAPILSEEYLQTAASLAVDALAQPNDVPALLQAVSRGTSSAQLVAMRAATRLAPAEAKAHLAGLLAARDERVRLAAARGLANLGERRGVLETLVSLLAAESVTVRTRSYHTLEALTGQRIAFAPEGSPADRAAGSAAWRRWVEANGAAARFHVPLADRAARLGRILITTPSGLVELDAEKKERWRARLPGAAWGCQGLASGNRLVAINSHSSVVEYDDGGQEVWKKDRLPGPPTSVQRLENGNTLVACPSARAIVEIAPDGKTTSLEVSGTPSWAERLDSGHTLVAMEQPIQRVIEVDSSGRIVWEARTGGHVPVHATRLENGNTLVTLSRARQVVEYDPTGQAIVWRTQMPLLFPVAAQRLPSGSTLVAEQTGVREIDATGKEVKWQLRLMQVMGLSAF